MTHSSDQSTLHTTLGDITLTLFPDRAPASVANFVGLATGAKDYPFTNCSGGADGPFYDGGIFHCVISGFIIQAGCPKGTGHGVGLNHMFPDEHHDLRFDRPFLVGIPGRGPLSDATQFFITLAPAPHLDADHTIFAEVADEASRDVVRAINSVACQEMKPNDPVTIQSITVESEG